MSGNANRTWFPLLGYPKFRPFRRFALLIPPSRMIYSVLCLQVVAKQFWCLLRCACQGARVNVVLDCPSTASLAIYSHLDLPAHPIGSIAQSCFVMVWSRQVAK